MTDAAELQQLIRGSIPLSEAMQFNIDRLSLDAIEVSAPLSPNINIHGTGFAGSIYSLAVLTGWALCTHIMEALEIGGQLVVARAEISYRRPVTADLICRCRCNEEQRRVFAQGLRQHGKGSLLLDVEVGDEPAALLRATYCAIDG